MAKRKYKSPLLLSTLVGDESLIIDLPITGETTGEDNEYTFWDDIGEELYNMITQNCGYFDLQEMDTDGSLSISKSEFLAWYSYQGEPWGPLNLGE